MGANKKKKRVLAPPAELLPVLFERLNEVFFCSNANSVLVWVSPNISNLLGYSIDEFIGGDARAVYVRPDDRQALIKVATEAKGSPISFEAELRRKDGGTIWAEMSVCASFDEAGAFKGIQGVVRDITDHWQTRRTLEESEDRFHRLSDVATEAICIHFQGKIVDFNQAFETLFRYSRDEFLEMWAWDVIDPRDIPLAKEMVKQHYEEPYEVRGVRKDGSIFPMEIYSKHSWMGEKSVRVTSIRDLTIRKHTEDELRKKNLALTQSNADLEQFAYVASHDLQTPLRNIVHFAQLLERRYKGRLDGDADDFIGLIVEGGKHLVSLINDLLEFSRVSRFNEPPHPASAKDAVAQALRNLAQDLDRTGAEVFVGDLPMVMADLTLLECLFQNLLGNALKYRAPDRKPILSVTTERESRNWWRFAVADNGIGIDPAYHDKIFEIFQRLDPNSGADGTGIGLTLCRRVVHRFGGTIRVESIPGAGSTFVFTLPSGTTEHR